ncbi:ABC transporter substrate-binding protein [Hoeflea prorocentri]|uniref:Sugar ABC transporter substrate-binding protein n=1 Tax=Hoeflea prorocentri TaxID=1922333 RepID=A0A9X3ZK42_9HYPH|nr:sugar ABC transporter substrate-binding protein [Hoeflea prorocentri]MCY6383758.1 sugar ABC transporter substrate-binding protein [Hoeflea prorocentri]MDA5401558.1 sugar ABC transporter substrate-binding protein [Hoeflea prorocentri]
MTKVTQKDLKQIEKTKNGITRRTFTRGALSAALAAPLLANPAFVTRLRAMDYSGKKLKVMINQPHAGSIDPLSAGFAELTGAEVEGVPIPYDQLRAQATLDVVSGTNEFDVFEYFYTDIEAMVKDGVLADITDRIEADKGVIDPDDFLGSLYDTYTLVGDRRYGLPYDGDTHVLFYNTELFDKHGLKPPKTWDDYRNAAETITAAEKDNGIYGALILAQQVPVIIGSSYANRLGGFGGDFMDADGKPTMATDEAIAAAQAMLDAAPHATPTPLETAFGNSIPLFLGGQAGMIEFWTDMGTWAEDPEQSKIVGKWGVVPMPVGGSNKVHRPAMNAGFGFGASTGAKDGDMAWEFVKMASSKDFHLSVLTNNKTGVDPTRRSAIPAYKEFAPKQGEVVEQAIMDAFPWPRNPESPELMQSLTDELGLMLAGNKTAEQAMTDTQASWEKILG